MEHLERKMKPKLVFAPLDSALACPKISQAQMESSILKELEIDGSISSRMLQVRKKKKKKKKRKKVAVVPVN